MTLLIVQIEIDTSHFDEANNDALLMLLAFHRSHMRAVKYEARERTNERRNTQNVSGVRCAPAEVACPGRERRMISERGSLGVHVSS